MKDLDPKSLIIGFLACFVFGVVGKLLITEDKIGRYQSATSEYSLPAALDTATGTMYITVPDRDNSYRMFEYEEVKVRTPIVKD